MIKDFLIINCIGKDNKIGLKFGNNFFIHDLDHKVNNNEQLVSEIANFLNVHSAQLDERFSVIVNQGPGSFSGIRVSLAVAKGLKIAKKIKLYGFNNRDLRVFNKENIEKLLKKNLVEKNLIKPVYLS